MQSYNFQKQTLLKTSPLRPQSLAYFSDKKRQLLVISGQKCIHLYNLTSEKFEDELKSPGGSISCVTVSDDLFFFAYGMHIAASGYNGKIIFDFDTYIAADKVDRMHVIGYKLWIFCNSLLNQFLMPSGPLSNKFSRKTGGSNNKVQDINSHMFEANINDSIAVEDQFSKHFLIILKSNNQLCTFEQKQICSYTTSSPPVCIIRYPKATQSSNKFLVGTMGGEIIHLEINKKQFKQIWVIKDQNCKGRINCLLQVKGQGLFLWRQFGTSQVMEIWGIQDRSMQAREEVQGKFIAGIYLDQRQTIIGGSTNGEVVALKDYTKMMKDYEKKNQAKVKQDLQKQISSLKLQLESLKSKSSSSKNATTPVMNVGISVDSAVTIDYQNLCSCLQLKCDGKIIKVILKGKLEIVKCSKLSFSGTEDKKNKQIEYTYVIQQQQQHLSKILYKVTQSAINRGQQKIKLMVYGTKEGKIYGITKNIDVKPLCYYHKIPISSFFDNNDFHELKITGQFKMFQIQKIYLKNIFQQFGESNKATEQYTEVMYESITNKSPLKIMYRPKQCRILTENPTALVIIKQYFLHKSKQKSQNFNYNLVISPEAISTLVRKLLACLQPLIQTKKQIQLLPSAIQIQNEQNLTGDLKQILAKKDQLLKKEAQVTRDYAIFLNEIKEVYVSFKKLKDVDVNKYDMDLFERICNNLSLDNLKQSSDKIIKIIAN